MILFFSDARIEEVNSVDNESMFNSRPTEIVTETSFRLSAPMVIEESMDEEVNSNESTPPVECEIDVKKLNDDDSPVKSLKMLAQICVDELREMQMKNEDLNKKTDSEIYVSSDSDSDGSLTETENIIAPRDVEMAKQNGESDTSTDHEDSDSSSSESDSSSDDDEAITDEQQTVIPEPELMACDTETVGQLDKNDDQLETQNAVNNEIVETKSPTTLKELCKAVLDAHSMVLRYEVPSLKYLCEHSMSMYGIEIPTFLFVNEDGVSAIETSATYADNGMESENVYLRVEFDETELANLFNAAEEPTCELSEYAETINNANVTDNVSLIEQCVALESILSSPPHEHKVSNDGTTENVQNADYIYFEEENDNDQHVYEETVSQSDDNNISQMSIAAAKFKKQLQSKYVQSSRYYQMFIVNHILKKYFKFVKKALAKKRSVRKRLKRTIRMLDDRKRKREEEERQKTIKPQPIMARRRSARLLEKRRFSYCEERALESIRATTEREKVSKENQKPKEKTKTVQAVKQKENSIKQDTAQPIKRKSNEIKTNNKLDKNSKGDDKPAKSKKVPIDTVEEKKISSNPANDSSKTNNNNDKNNINNNVCVSELSVNNSAPFRDDVLERIAQKRILKRRLSVCERSISRPNDDFRYDEDGQISEMLSSFINNGLDDQKSGPSAKKRLTTMQYNINMNNKSNFTTYASNMSNSEPKSLSSLLKSLPSIERITFNRENLSSNIRPTTPNSVPKTQMDDMQPKPQIPAIHSTQSPFPTNIVKRVPPPRRKSCSASEWMVERSREYNFSPKNTFYKEFNQERMSTGIERFPTTDVQQQNNNRTQRNSPVSRISPQMRPNQDQFIPKINNNILTIPRRPPKAMQPNARSNTQRAWSPDKSMQQYPKQNIHREWSPIRTMQTNSRLNVQRSWSPERTMQPNLRPNVQREWSPERSSQQFNPFRERNRQMRTMPRAEPPRERFEPYNNRRMINRGPPQNIPMRNPNPSQFRPNNERFVPGVAFHTQNVPIKEYTTEKPNQQCNVQTPFQKQLSRPNAETTMHNYDPRLTSRVIKTSPVNQSPLYIGSPASQPSMNVDLSPISKEPTPNQSPIIELKLPNCNTTEKIPPNQIPIANKLPSPSNPLKHSPPDSLSIPKHSPPKPLFVPVPPKHSPSKSLFVPNASKPIVDPTQIYSLLQNCPAIENERRKNISEEKTPVNIGTRPNQSTQRNNTAIIIQNLLETFAKSNRPPNSGKAQEKSLPTGKFIYNLIDSIGLKLTLFQLMPDQVI